MIICHNFLRMPKRSTINLPLLLISAVYKRQSAGLCPASCFVCDTALQSLPCTWLVRHSRGWCCSLTGLLIDEACCTVRLLQVFVEDRRRPDS